MLEMPCLTKVLEVVTAELWAIVRHDSIRNAMAGKMIFEFLYDGLGSCTVQPVNFKEVGPIVSHNQVVSLIKSK